MKKQQLQPFKNTKQDLLFWIKHFLYSKIAVQKLDTKYTDDKKNKKLELFDRELHQEWMLKMESIDEVEDLVRRIKKNGLKALNTISTPLIQFYRYITQANYIKSIKEINTNQVNTYIMLNFKEHSDWTKKNYYTMIRGLFIFIDKYLIDQDNFMFNIGMTSYGTKATKPININPEKSTKYLEPHEFVKFINKISDIKSKHPNPIQPKLLLKIIAFTGIRANEARNLKTEDIGFRKIGRSEYMQIFIRGKDSSDGFVFIDYRLIKKEYEIEQQFREENNIKCKYLFYNRQFEQHGEKGMYDLIQRGFRNAGVLKPMNSHGIRHSLCRIEIVKYINNPKILYFLPEKFGYKNFSEMITASGLDLQDVIDGKYKKMSFKSLYS